jgi:hypothetical protein
MEAKKYNAVVFTTEKRKTKNGDGFLKYRNITILNNFIRYLNRNYCKWRYIVLYDGITKNKVGILTPKKPYL